MPLRGRRDDGPWRARAERSARPGGPPASPSGRCGDHLGFPSLFAYCTESLGFCEATAWRRITAARVCRRFPQAFALVSRGSLHLSALCALKPHLNADNANELFELCSGKSTRKLDALLAARFPKPDVRDSIRRLPTRRAPAETGAPEVTFGSGSAGEVTEVAANALQGAAAMVGIVASGAGSAGEGMPAKGDAQRGAEVDGAVSGLGARAAMPAGARHVPDVTRVRERALSAPVRLEPLSANRFGVRFTADAEFCELLERGRGLAAHRLPGGDLLTLLKRGLEAYERELTKERFGGGRTRRGETSNPDARLSRRSRHIPSAVANDVYVRDEGQCTFVSDDGRRCTARCRLELDHVKPWALGGGPTVQNLRLRCSAHNLHHAEQCFGRARIRAALASPTRPLRANGDAATKSDE